MDTRTIPGMVFANMPYLKDETLLALLADLEATRNMIVDELGRRVMRNGRLMVDSGTPDSDDQE